MTTSTSNPPAIDTFLFDIGNVLVTFDFSKVVRFIATNSTSDEVEIKATVERLIAPLETGKIDGSAFLEELIETLNYSGSQRALHDAYVDIFEANEPMHQVVDILCDNYRLILFSNTSILHKDWLFARYPVFAKFHDGIFSYTSGAMKPDDGMYLDAIKKLGINPAQTVYLDDAPANIATGSHHGFNTISYLPNQHAEALEQISLLGVDMPFSTSMRGKNRQG